MTTFNEDDDAAALRKKHSDGTLLGEVDGTSAQFGTICATLNPSSFADQPTRAIVVALQALFPAP